MTTRHTLSTQLAAGKLHYGHWCKACALSSAVRVPLYLMGEAGVRAVAVVLLCVDCDAETFEETDP